MELDNSLLKVISILDPAQGTLAAVWRSFFSSSLIQYVERENKRDRVEDQKKGKYRLKKRTVKSTQGENNS